MLGGCPFLRGSFIGDFTVQTHLIFNQTLRLLQVKESVAIPVIANGDVRNESDVERVKKETGVDGE